MRQDLTKKVFRTFQPSKEITDCRAFFPLMGVHCFPLYSPLHEYQQHLNPQRLQKPLMSALIQWLQSGGLLYDALKLLNREGSRGCFLFFFFLSFLCSAILVWDVQMFFIKTRKRQRKAWGLARYITSNKADRIEWNQSKLGLLYNQTQNFLREESSLLHLSDISIYNSLKPNTSPAHSIILLGIKKSAIAVMQWTDILSKHVIFTCRCLEELILVKSGMPLHPSGFYTQLWRKRADVNLREHHREEIKLEGK